MNIKPLKEIRLLNARRLQEIAGGQKVICEKLGKSQSQVSAFMGSNPSKGIGDKVAQQLEDAFGLPRGWMDMLHDADEADTGLVSEQPAAYMEPESRAPKEQGPRWLDITCLAQCIYGIETAIEHEPEADTITLLQKANMIAGLYASRSHNGGKPTSGDAHTAVMTVLVGSAH